MHTMGIKHPTDLCQRLHRVFGVHVAQNDSQTEGALQLTDAMVDVLGLEQVVPARVGRRQAAVRRMSTGRTCRLADVLGLQQVVPAGVL